MILIGSCSGQSMIPITSCSCVRMVLIASCSGLSMFLIASYSGYSTVLIILCDDLCASLVASCSGLSMVLIASCSGMVRLRHVLVMYGSDCFMFLGYLSHFKGASLTFSYLSPSIWSSNKNNILFNVLFLHTGAHSPLQSKPPKLMFNACIIIMT